MRDHLATLLDDFRRYDKQIAIVRYQGNRRRVSTYGEIARLAGRFAALLAMHGVAQGDRVLLWAENGAEWVAAFYGCMLRGVVVVPLDAYGSADFAERVAKDVQPKLVVGDALLLAKLSHTWQQVNFEEWPEVLPAEEAGAVDGLSHATPLQILFTSGTTGEPKGIVHTHGNVLSSVVPIEEGARGYMRYEKYVHPLRFLHTLPLSHVFGQTMGLWIPPIFAAEVHFESRLVAPRLIETIKRERISVLAAVPRVFALLKTHLETSRPGLTGRIAASQAKSAGKLGWKRWWRFRDIHSAFGFKFWALISGGGALSGPLEQFWNALGYVMVQGYGMTETTALITLNHPFKVAKGTIGKPLPGREVKLGPDGEVLVKGPMISAATWSGGQLHARESEWLATGDIAETQTSGELRFLGRKSEVIVTAAGVNIHPEDLEAAVEQQQGVAACAVVAIETATGPEPCAVLAMRGASEQATQAVEMANQGLAEFQRIHRWMLWPEPDLPRTSTGKVKRKSVAEWVAQIQAAKTGAGSAMFAASSDWLLALIAEISGETPCGVGNELRLTEDLHLDSLGRVQLAAAIEERLGMPPESGLLEDMRTLGELRLFVRGEKEATTRTAPLKVHDVEESGMRAAASTAPLRTEEKVDYRYSYWPWSKPFQWMRAAFIETTMRPFVWLLGGPTVVFKEKLPASTPMLIIANHVTAYDGPLIQYALPGQVRRHMATAMSGEMLEDFRHFRNPEHGKKYGQFYLWGPAAYWLATALFNVFPLPRLRDFQRSFAHAGEALDRGFHVLIFPEGTRSASGQLGRFRPGIGLLAKQSDVPVLPVALCGVGELKAKGRGWFRSGKIAVRVGAPIRFSAEDTETVITERLREEVQKLLEEGTTLM